MSTEKTRVCFACNKRRNIRRFPNKDKSLHPGLCTNCRHSHRLDDKNKSFYFSTDTRDQDVRLEIEDLLDGIEQNDNYYD